MKKISKWIGTSVLCGVLASGAAVANEQKN